MKNNKSNINLTPEFAEVAGIHAGDGYLRYEGKRKEIDISGSYEEKDYYDNHVIPLFNKTFNLKIQGKYFPSRRTYGFVIRNQHVLDVFKNLGFPSGSKSTSISIPEMILNSSNPEIISRFLRGIFDTDGNLNFRNRSGGKTYSEFKRRFHYYPRISITSVSENLINDSAKLLLSLGFRLYLNTQKQRESNWNTYHRVILVGEKNLIKWMDIIGTKNPTKYSRFLIWRKFGFCPTNINYNQRINILEGKLNPYSLYVGL